MHTIRLRINDQVYDKIIWLLGKFSKDEVEIVVDDPKFLETKMYLESELDEIKSGKAKFLTLSEAEERIG
jgi:hypothetical protein